MNLVRVHFGTERHVHALVTCNRAFAFELGRHDGGVPMPAIALEFAVLAVEPGLNSGFQFFGSHDTVLVLELTADFVARVEQVYRDRADHSEHKTYNTQAQPGRHIACTKKSVTKAVNHVEERIEVAHALPERRQ